MILYFSVLFISEMSLGLLVVFEDLPNLHEPFSGSSFAINSSTMVFHSLQEGQRPNHFGEL
jgi:hypothetical protein